MAQNARKTAAVPLDEAVAVTLERAEDAVACADALEISDLLSEQARADADRALAAHRAAVIEAANATRRSRVAEALNSTIDTHVLD